MADELLVVSQTEQLVVDGASAYEVIDVTQPAVILEVAQQGPVGPPGAPGAQGVPGPPGGAIALYTQSLASATWTCPHNLGRYPGVTVTDGLGNVVTADIFYVDENIVRVTHGSAIAGVVYFN